MNKKLLFFPVILVSIVSLSGCSFWSTNPPSSGTEKTGTPQTEKAGTPVIEYPAGSSGAVLQENIESCDTLGTEEERNTCAKSVVFDAAVSTGTEEGCESLTGTDKENCLFSVYVQKGIQEKKTDACQALAVEKMKTDCSDQVWRSIAISTNKQDVCKKIITADMKTDCIETLKLQPIVDAGNVKECTTITTENLKTDCYNNAYYNKALEEKDPELCKNITAEIQAQVCAEKASQL